MTPELQNIAIAEICNWKRYRNSNSKCGKDIPLGEALLWEYNWVHPGHLHRVDWKNYWHVIPHYVNSLDAMHTAEKSSLDFILAPKYEVVLADICNLAGWWPCRATAMHRAKALLMVFDKWENEAV